MLKVRQKETASMLTRDGVRLDADIYRPDAEGEFPVLLMRQPYGERSHLLSFMPTRLGTPPKVTSWSFKMYGDAAHLKGSSSYLSTKLRTVRTR
jgi:predicted acyl esterase